MIESFADLCGVDDRILAAFVGGSFATGTADQFSDLDLYAIVRTDAYDEFVATHREFVERFGEPVFLEHFDGFGFDMFVFILASGVQGELSNAKPDHFLHIHGGPFRILVDKGGLLDGVEFPLQRPTEQDQTQFLRETLHWFWRDLSLYSVAMARCRLWTAVGYLESMRRRCINLVRLREDFGAWAGGYEKLEGAVPEEDLAALKRSFSVFDAGAMARAAESLVSFYRRHASELAGRHDMEYPLSLEEVVLSKLSDALARARGADDESDG